MTTIKFSSETDVKRRIKEILTFYNWFHWPASAGPYTVGGIADRLALWDGGVFMAIESKFKGNKPTERQKDYLRAVRAKGSYAFVVDEKTVSVFESFMASFHRSVIAQSNHQDATDDDKQTLVNAMTILIQPFMETT